MSGNADAVGPLLRTPESLGAALRTLRLAAGLSQAELAEWSGVSRQYVVQLEGGDVSQQVRRLLDLFAVLGADLVVVPRGCKAVADPLAVWLDGDVVARLVEPRTRQLRLEWTEEAVATWGEGVVVLSASLPVRARPWSVGATRPFVEGLLPEGEARTLVQRVFSVPRGDVHRLLGFIGADCAGAVQVLPDGVVPSDDAGRVEVVDAAALAVLLRELPRHPLGAGGPVRLSLAGLQDKLLLVRTEDGEWARPLEGFPSTLVLKPQPALFPDLVAAEAFGLALARAVGLEAAVAEVLDVEGRPVLAVERFDRRREESGSIRRVHQEDFCQASGTLPERKDEQDGGPGWRHVAGTLRRVATDPLRELTTLARILVHTVVLGNADAHARNLSLVHDRGLHRLAPLYDQVPTVHLATVAGAAPLDAAMAMSVDETWDVRAVSRRDVLAELASWPVPRRVAQQVVDDVTLRAVEFCRSVPGRIPELVGMRAASLVRGEEDG